MVSRLFYYQLVLLGLLWLFFMWPVVWPSRSATVQPTPAMPITPRRQRSNESKPFAGLTQKPHCAYRCVQQYASLILRVVTCRPSDIFAAMNLQKMWVQQCRATRTIRRRFGVKNVLDYQVGRTQSGGKRASTRCWALDGTHHSHGQHDRQPGHLVPRRGTSSGPLSKPIPR
jgi:hypothetical protein